MPEINRVRLPNNQVRLSNNHLSIFNLVTVFFKENEIDFDEKVAFGNDGTDFLIEAAVDCNNEEILHEMKHPSFLLKRLLRPAFHFLAVFRVGCACVGSFSYFLVK